MINILRFNESNNIDVSFSDKLKSINSFGKYLHSIKIENSSEYFYKYYLRILSSLYQNKKMTLWSSERSMSSLEREYNTLIANRHHENNPLYKRVVGNGRLQTIESKVDVLYKHSLSNRSSGCEDIFEILQDILDDIGIVPTYVKSLMGFYSIGYDLNFSNNYILNPVINISFLIHPQYLDKVMQVLEKNLSRFELIGFRLVRKDYEEFEYYNEEEDDVWAANQVVDSDHTIKLKFIEI